MQSEEIQQLNEASAPPAMASAAVAAGKRKVPSVTEVLQSAGLVNTDWFTEEAAWRGSVVHMCCQLDDENDLDESSVPEEAAGYLEAWRRLKREMAFVNFDAIEQRLENGSYRGKPDRIVGRTVIDLKSGALQPWVALQLAAYAELSGTFERIAVAIKPDGTYSARTFSVRDLRADLGVFKSALAIHSWKEVH